MQLTGYVHDKSQLIKSFSNWTPSLMHDGFQWQRQGKIPDCKHILGRKLSRPKSYFCNTCIFPSVIKFQFLFVPFIKLYTCEDVTKGEVNNIQLDGLLWDWRWSGSPFCDYNLFAFVNSKRSLSFGSRNTVFWNENRYLTNLCSYLLLIIIKIIFPSGKIDAMPEVDTLL